MIWEMFFYANANTDTQAAEVRVYDASMVYHPHIGVLYIYFRWWLHRFKRILAICTCSCANVYFDYCRTARLQSSFLASFIHFCLWCIFCGDAENTILFIVIRLSLIRYIFTPSNVFIFDRKRKWYSWNDESKCSSMRVQMLEWCLVILRTIFKLRIYRLRPIPTIITLWMKTSRWAKRTSPIF